MWLENANIITSLYISRVKYNNMRIKILLPAILDQTVFEGAAVE